MRQKTQENNCGKSERQDERSEKNISRQEEKKKNGGGEGRETWR